MRVYRYDSRWRLVGYGGFRDEDQRKKESRSGLPNLLASYPTRIKLLSKEHMHDEQDGYLASTFILTLISSLLSHCLSLWFGIELGITGVPLADNGVVAINIDESNIRHPPPSGEPQASESAETSLSAVGNGKAKEGQKVDPPQVITIEELDKLRSAICGSLIDRSLDVLWVNSTVTFELSSLLTGAFGKVSESSDVRKEVASTILQSVMSLQADEHVNH
ncbi:hypothetical protein B9Z19DRAFT_1168379 [Tuber borchii]|uniref:Uncharacterized protein n=1 Tax=Tuber borchii TaxID=42251 RepID=A0A2T7A052_TUBBO|nr:hypothetical protein B9Z19DRAFT_1168379 [Tuber borchii]